VLPLHSNFILKSIRIGGFQYRLMTIHGHPDSGKLQWVTGLQITAH